VLPGGLHSLNLKSERVPFSIDHAMPSRHNCTYTTSTKKNMQATLLKSPVWQSLDTYSSRATRHRCQRKATPCGPDLATHVATKGAPLSANPHTHLFFLSYARNTGCAAEKQAGPRNKHKAQGTVFRGLAAPGPLQKPGLTEPGLAIHGPTGSSALPDRAGNAWPNWPVAR